MQESTSPTQGLTNKCKKLTVHLKETSTTRMLKTIFQMTFRKETNTHLKHISEDRSQSPRPLRIFKLSQFPSHLYSAHSSKCRENSPKSCRLGTELTLGLDGPQEEGSSPDRELSPGTETPAPAPCKSWAAQTVVLFLQLNKEGSDHNEMNISLCE